MNMDKNGFKGRQYLEIIPIPRSDAEVILKQGSLDAISLTLVRLAYHEPDWKWVQDVCIALSSHQHKWIRQTCAICFGHLARIHGKIEKEKVLPIMNRLLQDSEAEVKGEAEISMDDFRIYIK